MTTAKIREPFSSISHLLGAIAAVPITVGLLKTSVGVAQIVSCAIFGAALFLLYAASGVYHAVVRERSFKAWRIVDHCMIFVLIAGTYTPICVVALKGAWGVALLSIIWGLALMGMLLISVWIKLPRWVSAVLYVAMGWVAVAAIIPLRAAITADGVRLLLIGGAAYTVGAVIYALGNVKRLKHALPAQFGFHEIFHVFILLGSAFHIVMVFQYVLI